MPEINRAVIELKDSIKDFLDLVEKRAKREKVLTTDMSCRREMENLERQATYQKKLFGIL